MAKRSERKDPRPRADPRAAGNDHMGEKFDAIAKLDRSANVAERPDPDTRSQLRARFHHR